MLLDLGAGHAAGLVKYVGRYPEAAGHSFHAQTERIWWLRAGYVIA